MRFAAILPHTLLYGGVKRFFEIGNILHELNHEMIVFTPDGKGPDWYMGPVVTLAMTELDDQTWDAAFITDIAFLNVLVRLRARLKVFYFVKASDNLRQLKKYPEVVVFANSSELSKKARRSFGLEPYDAFGGINTDYYVPKIHTEDHPEGPFVIMAYGRLSRPRKGTRFVVRACEKLYREGFNVRLLLFDTVVDEDSRKKCEAFSSKAPFEFVLNYPIDRNLELYHRADVFVSAEKHAGYSNTSAEAMASGIPVIATTSGTRDFLFHLETGIVVWRWTYGITRAIRKLMRDPHLRKRLATNGRARIETISWRKLTLRILAHPELRT